jgi:hypothetical protein
VLDRSRFQFIPGGDLAAPPQPDAAIALERWAQRNFKPAGALGTRVRNRHAVGNDNKA